MRFPKSPLRLIGLGTVGALLFSVPFYAQTRPALNERAQMRHSIEILENVLDTVRQQAMTAAVTSSARGVALGGTRYMYFQTGETNRTEGIFLTGYGVIFEVYVPTFTEQRTINIFFRSSQSASAASLPPTPPPLDATTFMVKSPTEPSSASLKALAALIDSYSKELQGQNRDAALRNLFAKLRSTDLFSQVSLLTPAPQEAAAEMEEKKLAAEEAKLEEQRRQFQDSIIHAIADYGSSIPGLDVNNSITVLLKGSMTKDASLFSPPARTSRIIHFYLKDLEDYKVGKISFDELKRRVQIEQN